MADRANRKCRRIICVPTSKCRFLRRASSADREEIPQGLKADWFAGFCDTAEAAPFQDKWIFINVSPS
jgi:hypothetical protein